MAKRWEILSKVKTEEILKSLLANRGIKTQKEIKEFLAPLSPYELTAKDLGISSQELTKAVNRLKKAIANKGKVIAYGDYDTDGICATATMWEVLHGLGLEVMPFIPTRPEGYGMKVERLEQFKKEGVSLVVTVDQGIVAYSQAEHARKIGLDVIVTDHHPKGKKRPKAVAVVHTAQLAGVGVAWFLANYLSQKLKGKNLVPKLDLVTIGTITDVMPLLGANRAIVKHGLADVSETERPGLMALYQAAGIAPEKIGTYEVSFIIGPRINAAGRMDDPMDSLRLICTRDSPRAISLAQILEEKNKERQVLMKEFTNQARALWLAEGGQSNLIFVAHETFQEGIVGLVAGKLMEEFYRPVVIVACQEKFSRASARSIKEFDIAEALRACSDLLENHGGHPRAAGLTVATSKINLLKKRLIQIAEEKLDKEKLVPVLKIDLEVNLEDLSFNLYQQIAKMAPFGEANPEPLFLTRNLVIKDASLVGNDGKHLKLLVTAPQSSMALGAIGFGLGEYFAQLAPEKKVDLVYNLISDQWNEKKRLQLKIKDLRMSDGEGS